MLSRIKYPYIRFVLALLVLGIGLFFVISDQNFDTDYNKAKTFTDIKLLQMQEGDKIEQKIVFDHKTVHSIGISVVNRTNACEGDIEIALLDSDGNKIWAEMTRTDDYRLQRIKWYKVKCDIDVSKVYVLCISSNELNGIIQLAGVDTENSAKGAEDAVMLNGRQQDGASLFVEMAYSRKLDKVSRVIILAWTIVLVCHFLAFEVLYADKRRSIITVFSMIILAVICAYMRLKIHLDDIQNRKFFAGMIFVITIAVISGIIMLIRKCRKVEIYFVVYAVLFGVLYSILLPPFSAPDEDRHYLVAYRLSNAIMMQNINDSAGHLYMRQCDMGERVIYVNHEHFVENLSELFDWGDGESKEVTASNISYNFRGPITLYFPQALGIVLGKLLRVNYVQLVYCGRFMNLLFFVVLTAIAIKIIPYGKWIIFAICQIPLVMELVTSYSYDALILAMTFLIVACILRFITQKEKLSKKQMAIFAVMCIIYAPLKPVYIPIIAIILIIPNKHIGDLSWRSILYKAGVLLAAVMMTVGVYKYSIYNMKSVLNEKTDKKIVSVQEDDWEKDPDKEIQISDQTYYTHPNLNFMMENPFDIFESYAGVMVDSGDELILAAFGKYLSWYDVILPTYVAIFAMALIYMAFAHENYSIIPNMDFVKRCWVVFMIFGTCFAVLLTFYLKVTDPSNKTLLGVQGRYFIPIFAAAVYLLRGGHKKNCDADCSIVMMASALNVMALMEICKMVWRM